MGLMTGQHPNIPYPAGSMPAETLVAQPAGSPVCPLGFDGRLLAPTSAYPPRFSMADLYGAAYPDSTAAAAAAAGYMAGLTPGHPAAMLYPTALAASPYELKDPRAAWAALPPSAGYPCDSQLAMYGAYGDRFDPVDSEARRRNATRETTSTLKAWLNEHRKNPYPTKGEKIMLAIITKMTLTQVSTWFANARRRLKKENKMTWEPRNKTADDLDDVSIDEDEDDKKDEDDDQPEERKSDSITESIVDRVKQVDESLSSTNETLEQRLKSNEKDSDLKIPDRPTSSDSVKSPNKKPRLDIASSSERNSESRSTPEKPKIWSLAQTATSTSPPSVRRSLGGTLVASSEDLENRLRINRLLYHDRLLQSDISNATYNQRHRDMANEFRTRVLQDSSSESSMSSPPLWRTGEPIVPFDSSDLRTLSSSVSPAVCSTFDGHPITSSHSYSPARFLGCRLLPGQESVIRQELSGHPTIPMIHERYHSPPTSLDLRTIHSTFMRPSTFGCPVSFSSSPSQVLTDIRR